MTITAPNPVKMPFATALGRRIAMSRRDLGLSQEDLAERVNEADPQLPLKATQTVISRWEIGRRIPSAESLTALARSLKVSTDYLLGLASE